MTFYMDQDGAIWQSWRAGSLCCIYDPDDPEDTEIGIPTAWYEVSDNYGPLVEVSPSDWKED